MLPVVLRILATIFRTNPSPQLRRKYTMKSKTAIKIIFLLSVNSKQD